MKIKQILVATMLAALAITAVAETPNGLLKDLGIPGPLSYVSSTAAIDTFYFLPTTISYRIPSGTSTKVVREGRDARFVFAYANAPWRYKAYGANGTDPYYSSVDSTNGLRVSAAPPTKACWVILPVAGLDSMIVTGLTGTDTVFVRNFY